jgi:hypothetical protein
MNISEVAEIGAKGKDAGASSTGAAFLALARLAAAFLTAVFSAGATSETVVSLASLEADFDARFTGFLTSAVSALAVALEAVLRTGFFAVADSSDEGAFDSSFFTISGALQAACET